jgi:hypothetical protein
MALSAETRNMYEVHHVGHNYFGDVGCLTEAALPEMKSLNVYESFGEEENKFADISFPAKIQPLLIWLCTHDLI